MMIYLSLKISNPFSGKKFKNLFCRERMFLKTKAYNVEVIYDESTLFELEFATSFSGYDHAGPEILVVVLGYGIYLSIYDTRHWDVINNKWEENSNGK